MSVPVAASRSEVVGAAAMQDATLQDAALEQITMRRVSLRILPFMFLLYIFNFLDRSNVGLAALQMNQDLGFSSQAFGLGAGIFFIGYSLFEVPSNLLLVRVGARRWIARIMITWGIIASIMMFVTTPLEFYILRFLLGVAEAGFFPAIIYYLSQWFPAKMRARSMARFMIAIPLAGLLGGPLGGWLLDLDGKAGLQGWQWLFVVEGIPSVVLGLVTLKYLTEHPRDATWLSAPQRLWLMERLRKDQIEHPADHGMPPLRALLHPLIWLAAIPELLVTTAGYAYLFWGPLLIRETLKTSNMMIGLWGAAIAVLSAAAMLLMGAHSDKTGERTGHAAICAAFVSLGCVGAAVFQNPYAKIASLILMQVAVISFLAPFWCIPSLLLSGSSAAVGIALVNAIGNVGGFIGPTAIGFLRTRTGGDTGAFLGLGAMAATAAVIIFLMGKTPQLRNQRESAV